MRIISGKKINGKTLQLIQGDITERDVDAIVNAANSYLQHGGGVAGAIVRKGGKIIQEESDRIGFVPVGHAAITTAGGLRARFVIHAVGPRMGEGGEDEKLRCAILGCLVLASERGLKSVSIPAISSGIFGFPKDRCAMILIGETVRYLRFQQDTSLERVEFCLFDTQTAEYFERALEEICGACPG